MDFLISRYTRLNSNMHLICFSGVREPCVRHSVARLVGERRGNGAATHAVDVDFHESSSFGSVAIQDCVEDIGVFGTVLGPAWGRLAEASDAVGIVENIDHRGEHPGAACRFGNTEMELSRKIIELRGPSPARPFLNRELIDANESFTHLVTCPRARSLSCRGFDEATHDVHISDIAEGDCTHDKPLVRGDLKQSAALEREERFSRRRAGHTHALGEARDLQDRPWAQFASDDLISNIITNSFGKPTSFPTLNSSPISKLANA